MEKYCIGIDIGTGSVRAALVNVDTGKIKYTHSHPIEINEPEPDFFEQSSQNIYESICICVKKSVKDVDPKSILGIGIDATCSLVCVDEKDNPISISKGKKKKWNVILWADHRSIKQANRINQTKHDVLKYVGGTISPEMETPKLLWLKDNLPETFNLKGVKFFDLADYFVFKLTGSKEHSIRSTCTTICKWTYVANKGWNKDYFEKIGLNKISDEKFKSIGTKILPMGTPVGPISSKVAKDFNITQSTIVAVGIIDAHSAGIGIIGAKVENEVVDLEKRLALIAGTSCCHMAINKKCLFAPGIWGPYEDAMVPGFFLSEGGQSAVGKLIDHVIKSHSYYGKLKEICEKEKKSVYEKLNEQLEKMRKEQKLERLSCLTKNINVLPYFHGNRSPIANPELKGMICGLTISNSIEDMAIIYLATIQALAFGTKHIIEEMNKNGHKINSIFICGGLKNNPVYVEEHSKVLGMDIHLPNESESACVGAAILGAVASKYYKSIQDAMKKMNSISKSVKYKKDKSLIGYFEKKYEVYKLMYKHQLMYDKIMK